MEAELLLYTEEQEEKIKRLREEAEREREDKRKTMEWLKDKESNHILNKLKEDAPVFVKFEGKTISGRIIKVRKEKRTVKWSNTVNRTKEFTVYDVKTPLGVITVPLSWEHIQFRHVEDLSNVEIPDELKKLSTRHLLAMLRWERIWQDGKYSKQELKAELALRPHVRTKRELQKFNAFKKKRKKK